MSRAVQETVVCPDCKTESPFTMWTSLNVSLDRDRKEALLSGELFRFTCPSCAAQSQILYPLLYHDMERQLMIWMVPPDETGRTLQPEDAGIGTMGRMKGYTFRTVNSLNELYEKILTFDAALDDYAIEMVKLAIAAQVPEPERSGGAEIYFAEIEPDPAGGGGGGGGEVLTFAVVTPAGTKGARVPREPIYSSMQKAVAEFKSRQPPPPPGQWPRVNAEHLMTLMDVSNAAGAAGGGAGGGAGAGDAGGSDRGDDAPGGGDAPSQPPPPQQKKPWWKPW